MDKVLLNALRILDKTHRSVQRHFDTQMTEFGRKHKLNISTGMATYVMYM